jgi:hypothetical protein
MSEREYAYLLLTTGESFRLLDGRWENGFVDPEVLQGLVNEGVAEIYKLQGMDFVRLSNPLVP